MIESKLIGTLRGRIWMPDIVCTKDVSINLSDMRARYVGGPAGTFRHAMCSIAADGDFQSASLTRDSAVLVESRRWINEVLVRRTRFIPITKFKSVRDLLVGYRSPASRKTRSKS